MTGRWANGDPLDVSTQVLGVDDKRVHLFHTSGVHAEHGSPAATNEVLLLARGSDHPAAPRLFPETRAGRWSPSPPIMPRHSGAPGPRPAGRVALRPRRPAEGRSMSRRLARVGAGRPGARPLGPPRGPAVRRTLYRSRGSGRSNWRRLLSGRPGIERGRPVNPARNLPLTPPSSVANLDGAISRRRRRLSRQVLQRKPWSGPVSTEPASMRPT